MNNKVTINLKAISRLDFKHLVTYRVLNYLMVNFDTEMDKIKLNSIDIALEFNTYDKAIRIAIKELLDNKIIFKVDFYKNWYSINKNVFVEFKE